MSTERWARCPRLCHSASHVPRKPPETEPTVGKNPSPMHEALPQQFHAKSRSYRATHTCALRWVKECLLQPCWRQRETESKETPTDTEVVPRAHPLWNTTHRIRKAASDIWNSTWQAFRSQPTAAVHKNEVCADAVSETSLHVKQASTQGAA